MDPLYIIGFIALFVCVLGVVILWKMLKSKPQSDDSTLIQGQKDLGDNQVALSNQETANHAEIVKLLLSLSMKMDQLLMTFAQVSQNYYKEVPHNGHHEMSPDETLAVCGSIIEMPVALEPPKPQQVVPQPPVATIPEAEKEKKPRSPKQLAHDEELRQMALNRKPKEVPEI